MKFTNIAANLAQSMRFYSTNSPGHFVGIKEAILQSLPPDNGLYMPEKILPVSNGFLADIENYSFPEIAYEVSRHLLAGSIPDHMLFMLVSKAVTFDAPLRKLDTNTYVQELFHGPTLAFKDFGARFMAQLMSYLIRNDNQKLTILVATSGDTGGAVASGFYDTEGIEVIILYPKGRVSPLQEKQLTTLGKNISAVEVEGSFDDCQALVKNAFLDRTLNKELQLSSANSINLARLIPQTFYYFRAFQQIPNKVKPLVISVPSGNFGNLTAGLIAKRMGLPIKQFLAATNQNDIVPQYLLSGEYAPKASVTTVSNAMDVGNPSNFARMLDLYGESVENFREEILGYAFSDPDTCDTIKDVYDDYGYTMDPHTAVGYLAWRAYQETHPDQSAQGVIMSTAHPSKFLEVVEPLIGNKVEVPKRLASLADKEKVATSIEADYGQFKDYLMTRSN